MSNLNLNLIHDAWLPVQRASGATCWIAPHQLTDGLVSGGDPIVGIASGRPDFDGALTELLIGLAQVALLPGADDDWYDLLTAPPSPEVLRARFEPWAVGFELLGEGPRFMQDLEPLDTNPRSKVTPLKELLVEVPAGNTLKLNKDHFVKRDDAIEGLSLPAAAAALMMLQTYAPSGGSGHRTSLRGGGPLTTLLVGDSLWQTVWLNVLSAPQYALLHGGVALPTPTPEAVLPWMCPTRTSESGSLTETTGPGDVHPMQALWGMPRRITLDAASGEGRCMIYDVLLPESGQALITSYWTRPSGNNYDARWRHPLSPYTRDSDTGELNAQHGNPGALQYRHWRRWAMQRESEGAIVAKPIYDATASRRRDLIDARVRPGLWVFGYDFDNAKLRRWYDGQAPVFLVEPAIQELLAGELNACVGVAEHASKTLRDALKRGLFGTLRGRRWSLSPSLNARALLFGNATERFWQGSEGAFYDVLAQLVDVLQTTEAQTPEQITALESLRLGWAKTLQAHALRLYDEAVPQHATLARDIKAAVRARDELRMFTSPNARGVRELLHLDAA